MNPVVVDFETVELMEDGSTQASTEFYRSNFRVSSCAFSTRTDSGVKSWFVVGEDAIRLELQKLAESETLLVAHNIQFEMGVSKCRFPELNLNWYADTMRLVQNYDNGGDEYAVDFIPIDPDELDDDDDEDVRKVSISGLGLVAACRRILKLGDHKDEAYKWLRQKAGIREGQEGANLHLLPEDVLGRYNVGDTESTLALFEFLEEFFLIQDFNWRFDHELYLSTVRYIVDTKIRGVKVVRTMLSDESIPTIEAEIAEIERAFKTRFAVEIGTIEREKLLMEIRKRKTLKGRKNYLKRVKSDPIKWDEDIAFNVGSNKQLEMLFCGVLGMRPKFLTDKGNPSFKSVMLSQWGDGGVMLGKRRKRFIVLKQAKNLYELSEYDGRWHCDLKAAGAATGRMAGGSH